MRSLCPHLKNLTSATKRGMMLALLMSSGMSLSTLSAIAQVSPAPGTQIKNKAYSSFDNDAGGTTVVESNEVIVTISEVAGITVTASGSNDDGEVNPDDVISFDFTITNVGNDPTQFFIPGAPALISNGNFNGSTNPIQIIAYDPDGSGTEATSQTVSINVPSSGIRTGDASALNLPNGSIPPGGTVTVRVPVTVDSGAIAGDVVSVTLGETTPDGSGSTQNQPYEANTNDVYTQDNQDGDPVDSSLTTAIELEAMDVLATNAEREASASQNSAAIVSETPVFPPPPTGAGDGNACFLTNHFNNLAVVADPESFYTIADHTDPTSLTKVGDWPATSGTIEALTANPSTGTLYGFDSNRGGSAGYVGTIDPITGAFSDLSATGMTTLSHSTYGTLDISDVRGMAFQTSTNTIWAVVYREAPASSPGNSYMYLFKINASGDPITDAFNGEDYIAVDLAPYDVINGSGVQWGAVEALAFHPTDPSILYGIVSSVNDAATDVGHLFAVDVSATTPTAVFAPKNLSGVDFDGSTVPASTIYDVEGMSFDQNGDLVIVSSNAGGTNSNRIYRVISSGEAVGGVAIAAGDWEGIVCNTITASSPEMLLVKRITAINGQPVNPNDSTTRLDEYVDDKTSTKKAEDNHPYWPDVDNNGEPDLYGAMNAGLVQPGDEVEYTVYFLNSGNVDLAGIQLCDRLQPGLSFKRNAYGSNQDIMLKIGTDSAIGLTAVNDSVDRAEFLLADAAVPTTCNLQAPNDNGTLVLDITGTSGLPTLPTLPTATGAQLDQSYGYFKFVVQIDE